MIEKTYSVSGMTCASCAAHVQKAVAKLPGVETAEVNLATEKMYVRFDAQQLDFNKLEKIVENSGYGLIESTPPQKSEPTKKVELIIEGMSCAACSAAVERAVNKLAGVQAAEVNLATNRGHFEYDSTQVKLSQIKDAITRAGYVPKEIEGQKSRDLEQERREKEAQNHAYPFYDRCGLCRPGTLYRYVPYVRGA